MRRAYGLPIDGEEKNWKCKNREMQGLSLVILFSSKRF